MMHIYRKTGNRLCGHIPRLMVLACCHAMTVDGGHAQNAPAPVPAPVNAPGMAVGSVNPALLGEFPSLVAKEASLLGYWPLARNLDAAKGLLIIQSGKKKRVFRPGPQGQDASLDLSNGGYLTISPAEALDAPELTVELVCRIKYLTDGCLFGMRNGGATRFSLHYTTDSSTLKLWNGSQVIDFEADTAMKMGEWYHVALAISGTESIVWVNGKRCEPAAKGGMALGSKGLPFLLGTSDFEAGRTERAEIQAAHLAIYKTMLGNEAIVERVKALGWTAKLKPQPRRSVAGEIARIDSRITRIKKDYGVDVHYKYSHKDFKYGGRSKLDAFGFDDPLRADGFIINYSTNNRHEDIAVLSDYIFVRKEETKDLMEAYPAIQRKVALMVKFYQAISPAYDFSFYVNPLRGVNVPSAQHESNPKK